MGRRGLVGIVVAGLSLYGLVRSWEHLRRPSYESHVTGDAAVRAGYAMVAEGRYAEAISTLERAARKPLLEVEMSGVFAALADAYRGLDREGGSGAQRHKALLYEGLAQRARGDGAKAEAAFTEAIAIQPDFALAHESLGALLLSEGRNEDAIARLERATELDPGKAITRSNLAIAYVRAGRLAEAEIQYQQAVRLGYPKPERLREMIEQARAGLPARE